MRTRKAITCQGPTAIYIDDKFDLRPGVTPGARLPADYIYNNVLWNNNAGINVWASDQVYVFNNIVANSGHGPGSFCFDDRGQIGVYDEGVDIVGGGSRCDYPYIGVHGIGISTGGHSASEKKPQQEDNEVFVFNNLSYGNKNAGIRARGAYVQVRNNVGMNNGAPFVLNGTAANFSHNLQLDGTTPVFANPSALDFRLQAGSPALDAGTPASFFNFDLLNRARPAGRGWDIGPYEGVGDSVGDTPPQKK
jgi:hypothetical protein